MEFDWDEGNRDKNLQHGVHDWEIEEALADPRRIPEAKLTVAGEARYVILGRSISSGRYLMVVYTVRRREEGRRVRPISARPMSERQKRRYRSGR